MSYNPAEPKDLYKILNIESTATAAEIKKAFRELSMKWHPDKAGNTPENNEKFSQIKEAYDVLSNEESRKGYDAYQARYASQADPEYSSSKSSSRPSHSRSHREDSTRYSHQEDLHRHASHKSSRRYSTRETYAEEPSYRSSRTSSYRYWEVPSGASSGSSRPYKDSWAHFRAPGYESRRTTPAGRDAQEMRREAIKASLKQIQPIGHDVQNNLRYLTINHQSLWADFEAYGLNRSEDAELWYDLFESTRKANRRIKDEWNDIVYQTRDVWDGRSTHDSSDLLWRTCHANSKILHMLSVSSALREISYILSINFRYSYPEFRSEMVWLFKLWRDSPKK
ncbi:hypothetical protein F4809DRAFT_644080 [Biscogniauxia mediterranea]|nr:hypothetical protein F4809DRAFT_644080 [Biscogniauxia mediterranea]